jgi:K+-sensing histidine kinase KdpD
VHAPRPAAGDATPARPVLSGAVGGVLGLPAGAGAAIAAWAFGGDPTIGIVLAAGAAIALATLTTTVGAVIAGALCWACYDGFVLHRFGTLDGGRADLVALGVVVVAAVAARVVAAAVRHARTTAAVRHARTTRGRHYYAACELPDVQRRTRSVAR